MATTKRQFDVFTYASSTGNFESTSTSRVIKPSGSMMAFGSQLYDAILFVLTCKPHRRVLLKEHKAAYYLPFYPLKQNDSWKDQIRHCLCLLLKETGFRNDDAAKLAKSRTILHQLNQVQHPRYAQYIYQLVVQVDLENCHGKCDTGSNAGTQKWFQVDQVTVNHPKIWGPEPCIYLFRPPHAPHTPVGSKCRELSMSHEFKGSLPSKRWAMAQSIKYSEQDLAGLYNDFLQHCYPSQFMNQLVFEEFLAKVEMKLEVNSEEPGDKKLRLYTAFCIDSPYIRFKDLMLGMVAIHCSHGELGGELRARCIFRYYSKLGASTLSFAELVAMNRDIGACKKETRNPIAAAESFFAKLRLDKETDGVSLEQFVLAVGRLEIRGTASLFRSSQVPLEQIRKRKPYPSMWAYKVNLESLLDNKGPDLDRSHIYCLQCADPKYTLAVHSIACKPTTGEIVYFQEQSTQQAAKLPKTVREQSVEVMNPTNKYVYLRDILRRFSFERQGCPKVGPANSSLPSWIRKLDRAGLVEQIVALCMESRAAFLSGPRVIRTSSPVFVFGDIHGNFHDLMIYDHLFWRLAPCGFVANSLFLGDYVDRGNDSLECIIYLLCMRALLPDKFHLLRGNHEMRQVQQAFTTYRECLEKFGPAGKQIWECLNSVFDCMPFCAVVDEQIFAAHGGIPASSPFLETLYDVPVPLQNPNATEHSKTAWEVLWNDPVAWNEYQVSMALENKNPTLFPKIPPGFTFNTKRGTAYFYSYEAVDRFLELNGLKFLLRAHEVMPSGFQFLMDGRMMTLFSSSHYCGAANESAVVFIEDSKIRVIKIETTQRITI